MLAFSFLLTHFLRFQCWQISKLNKYFIFLLIFFHFLALKFAAIDINKFCFQFVSYGFDVMELRSVWSLLQQQCFGNRITSSCSALDNLLGGGIPVGSVTEVAGKYFCISNICCFSSTSLSFGQPYIYYQLLLLNYLLL